MSKRLYLKGATVADLTAVLVDEDTGEEVVLPREAYIGLFVSPGNDEMIAEVSGVGTDGRTATHYVGGVSFGLPRPAPKKFAPLPFDSDPDDDD